MKESLRRYLMGEPETPLPARPNQNAAARPTGRPNPVVVKVLGYRRFFAALESLEPRLSPAAVMLWCWLWTAAGASEGKGLFARTSERRLSARFGMARGTVRKRLVELERAGFVERVQRGRHNRNCTLYRVRPDRNRATG